MNIYIFIFGKRLVGGRNGWQQSSVNLSDTLFACKSVNFVGEDEDSTTGYYTSLHKSTLMLVSYILCLVSTVVMETSLLTPMSYYHKRKEEKGK